MQMGTIYQNYVGKFFKYIRLINGMLTPCEFKINISNFRLLGFADISNQMLILRKTTRYVCCVR